jgi:hypothetical protein
MSCHGEGRRGISVGLLPVWHAVDGGVLVGAVATGMIVFCLGIMCMYQSCTASVAMVSVRTMGESSTANDHIELVIKFGSRRESAV